MENKLTTITPNLPAQQPGQIDQVRVRKLVSQGLSHLSQDKEITPFLLFLMGDDIDAVAFKSGYPRDIILVTADHYQWEKKKAQVVGTNPDIINTLRKNLIQLILVATFNAVQKELTEVIAGKRDPEKCMLIPKSLSGLQTLFDMFNTPPVAPNGANGSVNVGSVQNLQVINTNPTSNTNPEIGGIPKEQVLRALVQETLKQDIVKK